MNSYGDSICFTSFGESHGAAIGGVVEGIPAGTLINLEDIRQSLLRRSGKGNVGVSPRSANESDEVEWLSGVVESKEGLIALGTPIAFMIRNTNAHSDDYSWMKDHFRPGHADLTYTLKYGIRDYRGGGRASARETASRVVAGCLAQQRLKEKGIRIEAHLTQVGKETRPEHFDELLRDVQSSGDSIGGIVTCCISGLPSGVGDPIFDKLQAHLAFAIMSINGCKGFEYGSGFEGTYHRGSELYLRSEPSKGYAALKDPNDLSCSEGIYGGISDGANIRFRCAFKSASTLRMIYGGRHDTCIAGRAAVVVEAMTALCLANLFPPD